MAEGVVNKILDISELAKHIFAFLMDDVNFKCQILNFSAERCDLSDTIAEFQGTAIPLCDGYNLLVWVYS